MHVCVDIAVDTVQALATGKDPSLTEDNLPKFATFLAKNTDVMVCGFRMYVCINRNNVTKEPFLERILSTKHSDNVMKFSTELFVLPNDVK